jgi:hypothetical protein
VLAEFHWLKPLEPGSLPILVGYLTPLNVSAFFGLLNQLESIDDLLPCDAGFEEAADLDRGPERRFPRARFKDRLIGIILERDREGAQLLQRRLGGGG